MYRINKTSNVIIPSEAFEAVPTVSTWLRPPCEFDYAAIVVFIHSKGLFHGLGQGWFYLGAGIV